MTQNNNCYISIFKHAAAAWENILAVFEPIQLTLPRSINI